MAGLAEFPPKGGNTNKMRQSKQADFRFQFCGLPDWSLMLWSEYSRCGALGHDGIPVVADDGILS